MQAIIFLISTITLTYQIPPIIQNPLVPNRLLITQKQAQPRLFLYCKQADDDLHIYLCTSKKNAWVLNNLDIQTDKNNQLILKLDASQQTKQIIRQQKDSIFFIQAHQNNDSLRLHYLGVNQTTANVFTFPEIAIPDTLKTLQQQLPAMVRNQIKNQFGHKNTHFLTYVVIFIAILAVILGAVYFWKQKQMSTNIDKQPTQLKQVMMAKMALQEQENRKASSGTFIRASQPPPKIIV